MEVQVKLEHDDLMAFNMFVLEHSDVVRKYRQKSVVCTATTVALMWAIIMGSLYIIDIIETAIESAAYSVILTAIFVPAFLILDRVLTKRRLTRYISEGADRSMLSSKTYSVTGDGIAFQGEFGSGRSTWKAVEDVVEADQHILVFLGKQRAYLFPKRAFPTPEEAKRFLELAREYKAACG